MNGDIPLARQWSAGANSDMGLAFGWLVVPAVTNIHVRLADSPAAADLDQITAGIDGLLSRLTRLRQPTRQVELLSLKAVSLARRGNNAAARQALTEAIALAEPRGLIRPIIDAGPQLLPLLQEMARDRSSLYLARLIEALQSASDAPRRTQPIPHLTPREREVLFLLAQYQTDRAIAETLVVSPLTVRSHIENMAEKLGVRGRRTVVDRARELGLLP
jgi:LuxR family maltose regulon positive regulatory protein